MYKENHAIVAWFSLYKKSKNDMVFLKKLLKKGIKTAILIKQQPQGFSFGRRYFF